MFTKFAEAMVAFILTTMHLFEDSAKRFLIFGIFFAWIAVVVLCLNYYETIIAAVTIVRFDLSNIEESRLKMLFFVVSSLAVLLFAMSIILFLSTLLFNALGVKEYLSAKLAELKGKQ